MTPSPASALPSGGGGAEGAGPRHVAIIMDGNGRWAAKRSQPRIVGHRQGVEAVRKVIRAAPELGITALTLYAFSSENWRRPVAEVSDLMGLLRHFLKREMDEMDRQGIRLRVIGDWRRFDGDIVADLETAIARTAANTQLDLTVALSYGGRDELVRMARAIAEDARAHTLDPAAVDASAVEARLDTAGLPPLDLLIRTSGEMRLSNFLLWQAAYAELLFVETLWPDFDAAALADAVAIFGRRDRRYGGR